MRAIKTASGEWYHIYNRGVGKKTLFHNQRDYARFLFLILYQQYSETFHNISRYVDGYVKHSVFNIERMKLDENKRHVELACFCIMPNHFHLMIYGKTENGIPKYMQKVLNAYTKYYNTKYKQSGHLFGGPYQFVHIRTNEQLLYLSGYIHNNPRSLRNWRKCEADYPWSSYEEYTTNSKYESLLSKDIVLDQFNDKDDYKLFLKENPAKNKDPALLIDSDDSDRF